MTSKPQVVAIAAAAAVLVLLGVTAAVVIDKPAARGETQQTTATSTDAGAPASPEDGADEPANPRHAVGPAWQVPKAGTYRISYTRTGANPTSYEATAVVAHQGKTAFTETRDRKSVKVARSYRLRNSTLEETGFVLDSASGRSECRWNAPITVVPSPASKAVMTATCKMKVGETPATVTIESTVADVQQVDAQTEGTPVPLTRVTRRVVLRTTAAGQTATRQSDFVEFYDKLRGLLAQSTEDAAETAPDGTQTAYRVVEKMLTLQPEVP